MADPTAPLFSLPGGRNQTQTGLPRTFVLDTAGDTGEPPLDSTAGKMLLMDAKRRALTEEVFVEQTMLKAPESFDKLMELVEGKAPASLFRLVNVDQSWIDSMARNVSTAEQMQRLFDVFRERDVTFKVKVIFCLKKLWEARVFEQYLSLILERSSSEIRAVMDLYHVAVILSFEVPNLTTMPADIFPYGSTAQHWVETHCGASVEASIRSVLCSYYIRIIHNIFSMNNVSNLHHIKPILSKHNTVHQARVSETEGGVAKLVDEVIFPMLCQPRSAACSLAVFLVVQLLSTKNPRLESFVRSHDFVTPLEEASRSVSYSHSRWSCSHLMKLMLAAPNLTDHALPCFSGWYQEACAPGSFDVRNIRFRFPFEFAHSILREGMERGPPSGKPAEQWASPIRHSFVLRAVVDGVMDASSPQRELRCLTVLKLVLASKWTTRKDILSLVSMPKFAQMPMKHPQQHHHHSQNLGVSLDTAVTVEDAAHSSPEVNDSHRKEMSRSGAALRAMKRAPSFFRKKNDSHKTLSRKALSHSFDNQPTSSLLHMPEKILLKIFRLVATPDLFTCCCVCLKLFGFIDNAEHGLWQHALERDGPTSMHAPLDDKHHPRKPEEAMLQWKQQCKALIRGQLPMALYRVAVRRQGTLHSSSTDDALHIDAAQAVNNEIVVAALKLTGVLQRQAMWWPDMDPFVESKWLDLVLSLAHCGDSLEVNRAAWRVFYQLLAYHNGMVDRMIESGFLEKFLRPLDLKANSVVIFNGLYYLTKLLSNETATAEHRKRMARKDVMTLSQWLKDHNIWPQWHTIYNAYQSDPRTHSFIFPAIASLFSAVHDSFLCKKLKMSLNKVPDYRTAISGVRDLARGKTATAHITSIRDSSDDMPAPTPSLLKQSRSSGDLIDEELSPTKIPGRGGPHRARATGKISEKRGVTASGVKVVRDCGRHGARPIDIDDGVALIRRNSDPGPLVDLHGSSSSPVATIHGNEKRRASASL